MSNYILDKAYTVNQSGGVSAHRVVVQATNAGECKSPVGAGNNSGSILGVTTHAQTENGRAVTVRKAGIALVEAASAISVGDTLEVADITGRVRTTAIASGDTTRCVGFAETAAAAAGDLIEVFLSIHHHSIPAEI